MHNDPQSGGPLYKLIGIISEAAVLSICLWEAGFIAWLGWAEDPAKDSIQTAVGIPILVEIGGGQPMVQGAWQGFLTLALGLAMYVFCKTMAPVLFNQFKSKAGGKPHCS